MTSAQIQTDDLQLVKIEEAACKIRVNIPKGDDSDV